MRPLTLVICATARECEALQLAFSKKWKKRSKNTSELHLKTKKHRILCVRGDIGKTATGLTIGRLAEKHRIKQLIGVGVAGSISKSVHPFDLVIAERVAFYDIDLTDFGNSLGQLDGDPLWYETAKENVARLKDSMTREKEHIHFGSIISGDRFVSSGKLDKDLLKAFENPLAVDMESAAVGMCAHRLRIPFTIIRAISDDAQQRGNAQEYEVNALKASERILQALKIILI